MALAEEFEQQGNFLFKYRSYFPVLFLLITLPVFYAEVFQGNKLTESANYWYLAFGVGIFGVLIRVFTVGFTPPLTSGRNTTEGQVAQEINETGLYSVVRHPLYVGNFFMWLAVALLVGNTWFIVAFVLLYWLYYEKIMYAEEAFMRGKFGDTYLNWAADKPAFIPKLQIPTKPKYPFSLTKVLSNEKNGIVALTGLFWLFDVLKNSVQNHKYELIYNVWFYLFVVSVLYYLLVKIIGKSTRVFEEKSRVPKP